LCRTSPQKGPGPRPRPPEGLLARLQRALGTLLWAKCPGWDCDRRAPGSQRSGNYVSARLSNAPRAVPRAHDDSEKAAEHRPKWQRVAVVTVQSCRKTRVRAIGIQAKSSFKKRLQQRSKYAQSEAPPQRHSHPRLAERLRHHPAISSARGSSAKTSQRGLDKNRRATAKIPRRRAHVRHAGHVCAPAWPFRLSSQ
jgi:hypothetical protein